MTNQASRRLSQIRPTEFISANKFLAETIQTVYGPGAQIPFARIHRKQYGTISVGPDAPNAPPILSDPFENDIDPFANEFDNVVVETEPVSDDEVQSSGKSVSSTSSELLPTRFRLRTSSSEVSQNQQGWKDPEIEGTEEEDEDEWTGFEDASLPSTWAILPPPPVSYAS